MASISVVMASYNGERFIGEQLASIARQERLPDELVVSDDGSTDRTLPLIEAFAATAPFRVHIHRNAQRLGYADNFLCAAAKAQSELVAFADQDDVWAPDKLLRTETMFGDPQVAMCAHQVDLIDERGNALGHFAQGIATTSVQPRLSLDPWGLYLGFTITIRRPLLDLIPVAARGPDSHDPTLLAAHDRWVYTLANACGDTALIARPLANYRQHPRNQFGKQQARRLRRAAVPLARIRAMGEAYTGIAAHRAVLFERAAGEAGDPVLKARLLAASHLWRQLSANSARREAVYREPARWRRMALWAGNVRASIYRPPPSHRLAFQSLVKDALVVIK